jgi:hypothetical protein
VEKKLGCANRIRPIDYTWKKVSCQEKIRRIILNHITVRKKNSVELILARSKIKAVLELLFLILFFGLWYSILIDDISSFDAIKQEIVTKVSEQKLLIIFFLAPLVSAKRVLLGLSTLIAGNEYVFSSTRNMIRHNGKDICKYHQVKNIQIRRIYDSDGDHSYRLVVVHSGMKKLFIAESSDRAYINGIASDIADICENKIEYKD